MEQLALSFDLVDVDAELGPSPDGFNVCDECFEQFLTIDEVWPERREFSVLICCPYGQELVEVEGGFAELPRRFWTRLFAEEVGLDVRGVADGPLDVAIDWGLEVREISRSAAQAFEREHHDHNEPHIADMFCLGAFNGPELVSVAVCGRPVAPANCRQDADGRELVLEVTRLCSRRDLDRPRLVWNASSQLYAECARRAKRLGAERVITYTRESETGDSLVASGFDRLYLTRLERRGWDRAGRPRTATAPAERRWCWERRVRKGLGHLNRRAADWARRNLKGGEASCVRRGARRPDDKPDYTRTELPITDTRGSSEPRIPTSERAADCAA